MTLPTIELGVSQLRDLLAPVLPFAGTDPCLPQLLQVHLQVRGEWLLATATDRHRAVVCRHRIESPPAVAAGFDALASAADLRQALSLLPRTRAADPTVVLQVVQDEDPWPAMRISLAGPTDLFEHLSLKVPLWSGAYPDLAAHLVAALAGRTKGNDGPFALNTAFLADLRLAVREHGEPLRVWTTGQGKPVGFAAGDHFLGLLMPVHMHADAVADDLSDWSALLGAEPVPVAVSA